MMWAEHSSSANFRVYCRSPAAAVEFEILCGRNGQQCYREYSMSQTDMQVWKERLIALRDRLRGEVRQMADTTRAEGGGSSSKLPTHIADLGTDAYDQEFTFQLMENEHEVLDQIKASLERIENGTYGQCEEIGRASCRERV